MSIRVTSKRKKQKLEEQDESGPPLPSTTTKRPIFWRSPINKPSSSNTMPGSSDQEMHIITHGEEVFQKSSQGLTEPTKTHQYINRPEGEMDMMVGFFLMNGVCISFFLIFGFCVIFSCLRKKPSFLRKKQFGDIEQVPLTQEEIAAKPKLKSIVSQVIKSNKVTTTVSVEGGAESMELGTTNGGQQVKVHEPPFQTSRSPSPQYLSTGRKPSPFQQVGNSSRKQSADNSRRCSISQENSAMIRHNLLGPLSFDDLHYM